MKHVNDAQTKLKRNIEEKLRKSQHKDKAMIEELQEEITQLQRTCSELEELSQSDDHLHLLQVAHLICPLVFPPFASLKKQDRRRATSAVVSNVTY